MKYTLPSLELFNAFEAVARHQSFTLAAKELCLTQSAVSRQIKRLEGQCDVQLFNRFNRRIELTQHGVELYDVVSTGLDEIAACLSSMKRKQGFTQIIVSASVSFAYFWLMPHLDKFFDAHPEVDLRILATDQVIDLHRNDADVAILYGNGLWEGVTADLLFHERVYPVCSPDYIKSHPDFTTVSDISNQTLIHLEGGGNIWGGVDWQRWLKTAGISAAEKRPGIRLNSYPMVIQAAQAGRGVALGWSYIVDEMVDNGLLICPFNQPLKTDNGYYVSVLKQKQSQPEIVMFVDWIIEAVANSL